MSVPWLARKVIKFMLSAIQVSISTEDLSAPVLKVDVRSRLGSISEINFILDGKQHSFDFANSLMFGLLNAEGQQGMYTACFRQVGASHVIRIERVLAERKNIMPVHIIHLPGDDQSRDLIKFENTILMKNKTTKEYERIHSHTEAFRRYL